MIRREFRDLERPATAGEAIENLGLKFVSSDFQRLELVPNAGRLEMAGVRSLAAAVDAHLDAIVVDTPGYERVTA